MKAHRTCSMILAGLMLVYQNSLASAAQRSADSSAEPGYCDTIECIKHWQADTVRPVVKPISIVDGRMGERDGTPDFDREMARAIRIVTDRISTDVASEAFFAQAAEMLDRGIAPDDETTRYTVLPDGTEDLLVVGGTKSDVRLMIGTWNPETGQYDIDVHVAWDGQSHRIVRVKRGIEMGRPGVALADRQAVNLPVDGDGAGTVTAVVPDVKCFGFVRADGSIRIVCLCYTNDSGGFKATICFDSGWTV